MTRRVPVNRRDPAGVDKPMTPGKGPEPMETPEETGTSPREASAPFRVISLLADDGKEPPPSVTDREASAAWCAATAPWHPAILGQADEVPRLEDVAAPSDPVAGEVR